MNSLHGYEKMSAEDQNTLGQNIITWLVHCVARYDQKSEPTRHEFESHQEYHTTNLLSDGFNWHTAPILQVDVW